MPEAVPNTLARVNEESPQQVFQAVEEENLPVYQVPARSFDPYAGINLDASTVEKLAILTGTYHLAVVIFYFALNISNPDWMIVYALPPTETRNDDRETLYKCLLMNHIFTGAISLSLIYVLRRNERLLHVIFSSLFHMSLFSLL